MKSKKKLIYVDDFGVKKITFKIKFVFYSGFFQGTNNSYVEVVLSTNSYYRPF